MSDLTELLERVEEATGPDRELDADLMWGLNRGPVLNAYWNARPGKPNGTEPNILGPGLGRTGVVSASPRLTASIDAALALVERMLPDVCVSVTSNVTGSGRRGACEMWRWAANRFEFYREHNEKNGHEHMHQNVGAATPPLAILAALLRALIAQQAKQ